jgi:amino-acid N-acetyltransferase
MRGSRNQEAGTGRGAVLRPARSDDLPAIVALLAAAHLPAVELEQHLAHVVVAELDGRVAGCGGLETYEGTSAVLVRSMAVEEALRGSGLGTRILEWLLERAAALGSRELFLFTMSARDFYLRFGFVDAALADFPEPMRRSAQYRFVLRSGNEWGIVAMAKRG